MSNVISISTYPLCILAEDAADLILYLRFCKTHTQGHLCYLFFFLNEMESLPHRVKTGQREHGTKDKVEYKTSDERALISNNLRSNIFIEENTIY